MERAKITKERTHYYAPAINIVMSIDINGIIPFEKLKTAILSAVHHHALLTSKIIQEESGDCFYVTTEEQLAKIKIIQSETACNLQTIINEQERIPFDLEKGELLRFFIIIEEGNTKLVMVAHHLAGDGIAMLYLLRDIMNCLSDTTYGKEVCPITLFDSESIPEDAKVNPFIRMMIKLVNKQWNKTKHIFKQSEFLEMSHEYWKQRKSKVITHTIKAEELRKLLDASKKQGVTVNSMITTAFLMAAQEEKSVGFAASVRPNGYEGMGNYATGFSIQYTYDKKKEFWKNAVEVHKLIYKKLNNNSDKYFLLNFMNFLEPTLIDSAYFSGFSTFKNTTSDKVCKMFRYDGNPQGISITNLTKAPIPETYGAFQINKLTFVPPIVPSSKRIIGIVTLGDSMTISMQYLESENNAKEEKIFMDALKQMKI